MASLPYEAGECLPPDPTLDQKVEQSSAEVFISNYVAKHGHKAGGFYWRDIVDKVINQAGCVGLCFYHGKINKEHMIIFSGENVDPVTKKHTAMIPDDSNGFVLAGNQIRLSEASEGQPPEVTDQDISDEYLDEQLIVKRNAKKLKRPRDPHAKKLIGQFRKDHEKEKRGGFFWKQSIDQILAQPGCIGIRYYFGINSENQNEMILYGVNASFHDIKS
jgi:hypothetical protein